MINLEKVKAIRNGFAYVSHMLDYPSEEILSLEFRNGLVRDYCAMSQRASVLTILDELRGQKLYDLQKHYSDLFDSNKRFTLYMTYYKFEDSRKRGTLLAKLKLLYEMFGLEISERELADYLPMMLEFLAFGHWQGDRRRQDINLLFQVIEDGTYHLLKRGREYRDDPYFRLIDAVRKELKACLEQEADVS